MRLRIGAALTFAALLLALSAGHAAALEAKDHDAFFLAFGTANITVRNSDALLSGSTAWGGFRLGLLSFLFAEVGFGAVEYEDAVDVGGQVQQIKFRTTGVNYGLGIVVPVRALRMGIRFTRSSNNRWAEDTSDATTGATITNKSGRIDYDSLMVFGQVFEGNLEIGLRRDFIRETDSELLNSFGVYFMLNF
ncbi:MAG: hypothetical protein O7A08_05930 [SAR324 cluster bacterium]|nr:hypothetical protein [SAR324 cluster bacterium]MCZ6532483.1 hypothetical protein [SAR324 cluster bacterium]MCZ6556188.1 hypothetical protein [SAR324 cluster bacterium]MCZ6626970.1 hypothetical protein [SAR324 cluster bacterium]MCZ6645603.1 hypothetical protein [SAR324 cluster bacterium]